MKTKEIKNGITKIIKDRKRTTSGAALENPPVDGADAPESLSIDQVSGLAGGGRPGNPEPPH